MKKEKRILSLMIAASLLSGCDNGSELNKCLGYTEDDVVFVVNADDVGMHPDMDKAVFDLIEKGAIQTASFMVPAPNFSFSAKYAVQRKMPVGLHLTLTNEWQEANSWAPLLSRQEVPSLYNPAGFMWPSVNALAEHANITDVRKELEAQIDKALAVGLEVTHLDFHMLYWAGRDDFMTATLDLAKKYQLPVISQLFWLSQAEQQRETARLQQHDQPTPDIFWMYYNPEPRSQNSELSYTLYSSMFDSAQPAFHHVGIHPAYLTESAKVQMQDAAFRFDEYSVWSDGRLNEVIERNNIKFTDYRQLKAIMAGKQHCKNSDEAV